MTFGLNECFFQMTEYIVPVFHHESQFARNTNGVLMYTHGKVDKFPKMDVDLVNFFDFVTLFKSLGYHEYKAMFWLNPNSRDLDCGLRPLNEDKDINEMCDAALKYRDSKKENLHLF